MKEKMRSVKELFSNKKFRRVFTLTVAIVLVLVATVGSTFAFIVTRTEGVKNVFDPVTIECSVADYSVKNDGDYSAYIRAYFVVNWVEDGTENVYGQKPVLNTDYTINVKAADNATTSGKWDKGSDGFYYYTSPVAAKAATAALIDSFSLVDGVSAPADYVLQVQMIAEAIQSKPEISVTNSWGVTVNDGLISK